MRYLIVSLLFLAGCNTFQPKVGMTLDEWQNRCLSHNWTKGNLVAAEGDVEVYTCDQNNVFHAFEGGKLVKVVRTEPTPQPDNSAALMGLGLGLINSAQPRTYGTTCTQMGNFINCY